MFYDSYIQNAPSIEYSLKKWYSKKGKMLLYDSIDAEKNIIYIMVFRKDGSPYMELEEINPDYKLTYRDRKGQITDVFSGKLNDKMVSWREYKDGSLKNDTFYNRFYYSRLDTLKYIERIIAKGNKRNINHYELAEGYNFTFNNHIRMVYNPDSVLISESFYNSRVKNCGYFIQYWPGGTISCIGEYDRRGYKTNDWYYFDEQGNITKRERYYNGTNIFN